MTPSLLMSISARRSSASCSVSLSPDDIIVMMRCQGSCLTNVSDQIFQLFEADKTAAGLVQGSECHLDSVEIMDNLQSGSFTVAHSVSSTLPASSRSSSDRIPQTRWSRCCQNQTEGGDQTAAFLRPASLTSHSRSSISASVGFMPMALMV